MSHDGQQSALSCDNNLKPLLVVVNNAENKLNSSVTNVKDMISEQQDPANRECAWSIIDCFPPGESILLAVSEFVNNVVIACRLW